jgi:glycosyltransferase involved in cell wall biosynthesis
MNWSKDGGSPYKYSHMKVMFSIGNLNLGGAEKQLVNTVIGLKNAGLSVSLILLDRRGPLFSQVIKNDIEYFLFFPDSVLYKTRNHKIFFGPVTLPFLAYRLYRHLRKTAPDIVHTWLIQTSLLILPLAFFARIPIRIFARRSMLDGIGFKKLGKILLETANHFATHFTVNAEEIKKEMVEIENIPAWKITYIANGVSLVVPKANLDVEPPRGIMVANFHAYKNHNNLLLALSKINYDFQMVLIGSGPLEEEVKHLAEVHGLIDKVVFLGRVENTQPLFLSSQFCVLTSDTEGMPNVILEAMSYGLPVISTDVGGVKTLIEDDMNGLLVPAGDVVMLRNAVERLIREPLLRDQLAKNHPVFLANFSWEKIVADYLYLYRELLSKSVS